MEQTTVLSKIELKYCELCGGLFLRPEDGAHVYCAACGPKVQRLAVAPPRKRPQSVKTLDAAGGMVCA